MTNTIDTSLLLAEYQKSQKRTASAELGKDDFLKLLITQLQNQDPTNPMEDTNFIAQMANFSSLEQMANINSSINKLVEQDKQSQLISYHQFVGQEVSWHKVNELEDGTTEIEEGSGKVKSIQFEENQVLFVLEDGTELNPSNISKVNEFAGESSIMLASMMIGKRVTYVNEHNEEISNLVQSVSFKNGNTRYHLDDEAKTILTAAQIIKIAE